MPSSAATSSMPVTGRGLKPKGCYVASVARQNAVMSRRATGTRARPEFKMPTMG
jgi:hypothetical protein